MQLWKYLQNLSFCEKNTAYEHEGGGCMNCPFKKANGNAASHVT